MGQASSYKQIKYKIYSTKQPVAILTFECFAVEPDVHLQLATFAS